MPQPSPQVAGQLRIIMPAVGIVVSMFGYTSDDAEPIVQFILEMAGPISLIVSLIWSFYAHSRASIIAEAALPAGPGIPAPVIVLPLQEEHIADKLPGNVVAISTPTKVLKGT